MNQYPLPHAPLHTEWLTGWGLANPTMVDYEQKVQESVVAQSTRLDTSAGISVDAGTPKR